MAGVEISTPAEKISGSGKSWRPAYCFGSAESPTADFLLDWLKSSRSDPRRYVASLSCRPQVRPQPRLPCFYEESLPNCTSCLYRPDMPKYTRKPKLLAAQTVSGPPTFSRSADFFSAGAEISTPTKILSSAYISARRQHFVNLSIFL